MPTILPIPRSHARSARLLLPPGRLGRHPLRARHVLGRLGLRPPQPLGLRAPLPRRPLRRSDGLLCLCHLGRRLLGTPRQQPVLGGRHLELGAGLGYGGEEREVRWRGEWLERVGV